jgi:hypothetical protein
VSEGAGTPRLDYGPDGNPNGLLVEAAGRTNLIVHSDTPKTSKSGWGGSVGSETDRSSIIKGGTANEVTGETTTSTNISQVLDTFSGSTETVSVIMEMGTSPLTGVAIYNSDTSNYAANINYDWNDHSMFVNAGSTVAANYQQLNASGPNGGMLVRVVFTYGSGNAENTSGESRRFYFYPDQTGGGRSAIIHHVQFEEAPNASSPIVTQGSPVTRAGDDYSIFDGSYPSWWNQSEGTIYLKATGQYFEDSSIGSFYLYKGGPGYYIRQNPSMAAISSQDEGGNTISVGSPSAFTTFDAALSLTASEMRLSVDGSSTSGTHDGSLLANSDNTNLAFGAINLLAVVHRVVYIPKALSEPTLNHITS